MEESELWLDYLLSKDEISDFICHCNSLGGLVTSVMTQSKKVGSVHIQPQMGSAVGQKTATKEKERLSAHWNMQAPKILLIQRFSLQVQVSVRIESPFPLSQVPSMIDLWFVWMCYFYYPLSFYVVQCL